ncbi:hypothetical protein IC617_08520 [Neiella sp. HB171785]|uniref:Uncharacterized protein n=1 Tax=Neiella litorisoli TaxID=2771431 RepID=A0A8J6QGF3_9GAMM|nr:hypothetical protein [Neiella litorisoli]MBD1389469.1 hypothetical protein [Neiella litorisoli]
MTLKDRLQANGIEADHLDSLVHQIATEHAQGINNSGIASQLRYLESQGVSETAICKHLAIAVSEPQR